MGRRLLSAAAVDRLLRSQSAVASCVADLPDLAEEDVWAAAHGAIGGGRWRRANSVDRHRHVGGLSRALEGGHGSGGGLATSEPVAVSATSWAAMGSVRVAPAWEEDGEQQAEKQWVPPHEYLAREHVPVLATSVFEGVGRTLKGRDMSRVRDAVWSQTGFFG